MIKWILRQICKIHFSFFAPFRASLASKFEKNANMTQKYFFQIFSIWISKNAKFDADFESVEKVAKKFTQRKLQGWELLYTVLKVEKVPNFYTFMQITFFVETFCTFFNGFKISIKFCVFGHPIKNVVKKNLGGHISTFCQLWSLICTKRLNIPPALRRCLSLAHRTCASDLCPPGSVQQPPQPQPSLLLPLDVSPVAEPMAGARLNLRFSILNGNFVAELSIHKIVWWEPSDY